MRVLVPYDGWGLFEEVTNAYDAMFATETAVGRPARTIVDCAE